MAGIIICDKCGFRESIDCALLIENHTSSWTMRWARDFCFDCYQEYLSSQNNTDKKFWKKVKGM